MCKLQSRTLVHHLPSYGVCPSVRPSRSCVVWKRVNISSNFFYDWVAMHTILVSRTKSYGNIRTGTPLMGASNAGGYEKFAIFDLYFEIDRR